MAKKRKKLWAVRFVKELRGSKGKPDTDRKIKDVMNSNSVRRRPKGQR